jgi:hypothetical protein
MLSRPCVSLGLAPNGNIKINNGPNIAYSYSVASDNLNSRSMKSLSTTSAALHTNAAGKYYPYYQKFIDYYGDTSYVDKIVTAAFTGTSVTLKNTVFDFVNHPRAARERTYPLNRHELRCCDSAPHRTIFPLLQSLQRRSSRRARSRIWSW